MSVLRFFFAWPAGAAWGNVIAMPLCALLAAVAAFLFRDRIGRALGGWWRRHFGHKAELAEIRDLAAKAHRIAADAYRHQLGTEHPDAPGDTSGGRGDPEV